MIPQKVQISETVMYEDIGMLAFDGEGGVSVVFRRIVKGEYGYTYTLHPLTDSDFELPPAAIDDIISAIGKNLNTLKRFANPKI